MNLGQHEMKCGVIDFCVVSTTSEYSVVYWLNRINPQASARSGSAADKDSSEIHKRDSQEEDVPLNKVDPKVDKAGEISGYR